MSTINKSALIFAHKIKANFTSWKEALKFAWKKTKLIFSMRAKVACFSFIKKSTGEETQRMGTLNKDYFIYEFKGSDKPVKWYILKFWDISKNDWRCLDVRTLTQIHW